MELRCRWRLRLEAPALGSIARGLIFVRVNQVLVRLWACLLACLTGCVAPAKGWPPASRVHVQMTTVVHAAGLETGGTSENDLTCAEMFSVIGDWR